MKQFSLTQLKTQQLWYFLDVAETGSFTRAAERNYTSQANVSYAMRELEQTLDVQLFIRKNNELILTQYAKAFLPYVQNAFEQLQDGCRILREMNNPASGSVRIGYSFVFSLSLAPDCNLDGYDISKIEIDHPGRFRDLYLIWPGKRKLSPAAEYCRQMIMDYYKVKKMQDK